MLLDLHDGQAARRLQHQHTPDQVLTI
jgi:hypothetical protein